MISSLSADAPLVVIVGPTASGKSALALWLAKRWGAEVLACDSTQVYRGFDIGTAKPTAAERGLVRHHLLDLVEPQALFTAGEYRKCAQAALEEIRRRSRIPIVVAGTGLYLRALLEGLADAPVRSEALRARLVARAERRGSAYLHRVLSRLDRSAAKRIAPRDMPKLVRAIEVSVLAGKPITEVHLFGRARLQGFAPIRVGLNPPRAALYERIGRRVQSMLDQGWVDEVRALLAAGVPRTAMVAAIEQATRHYAKRQLTWFRKEPDVRWYSGFGDDPETRETIFVGLQRQLSPGAESRARFSGGV